MKPKIKILQINAYYEVGSTGNIVKEIEEAGNTQGFEMHTIYCLNPKDVASNKVYYLGKKHDAAGIKKIFEWIFWGGKLEYNNDITNRIVNKIKELNPDIIHLHNLHGDFEYGTINIKMLFQFLATIHKKIIWTFHDCWPITGRCYHFEYKKCDKWKNGCGHCPQRLFDREGVFWDYSSKNWNKKKLLYEGIDDMTIVTVSTWLNSVVKKSILKNRNIITIYNGVDTEIFKPSNKEKNWDKYRILTIGWDRRKGSKDYYKLSRLFSEDMEMIVVGRRPFFRRYRRLPSSIREIDRAKTPKDMAEIYKDADVYFNGTLRHSNKAFYFKRIQSRNFRT